MSSRRERCTGWIGCGSATIQAPTKTHRQKMAAHGQKTWRQLLHRGGPPVVGDRTGHYVSCPCPVANLGLSWVATGGDRMATRNLVAIVAMQGLHGSRGNDMSSDPRKFLRVDPHWEGEPHPLPKTQQ